MDIRLTDYDYIVVNSSGGKDSQTALRFIAKQAAVEEVSDRVLVAHADLGQVEWDGTKDLAQRQAEHYGFRFLAIARPQGDLLQHIEQRGKFPSSTARYCTSDHKRGQIAKLYTQLRKEKGGHVKILNVLGMRAEESPARAKLVPFKVNERESNGVKTIHDWLPIHDWTLEDVWADIKASGVEHHPAYDLGMPRLSCVFCIFAPRSALLLAGKHNRDLLDRYVEVEKKIDHTFRQDVSLLEIQKEIESGVSDPLAIISDQWDM